MYILILFFKKLIVASVCEFDVFEGLYLSTVARGVTLNKNK